MAHSAAAYYLIGAALGYLFGSLPTGYLVGRRRGIDIREHGSGNIGATNVARVLGKRPGAFVFIFDVLKGLIAVRLAIFLVPLAASHFTGVAAALGCILGHNYPVWLRFRGGKGVATTIGVLLGLMPQAMLLSTIVWFAVFFAFRYVSLASLLAAVALPISVWTLNARGGVAPDPMFWFSVVAALLIFWRHRANLGRLFHGTEPKFARKPESPTP